MLPSKQQKNTKGSHHERADDTEGDQANSVRKVVSVKAPAEIAWKMFTEKISTWWPLATHKIGKAKAVDAVIEPRVGGRWYERGDDGSTCDWGCVLAWDPPARLMLSWDINADWQHDPNLKTEVEVRFIADGKGGTLEFPTKSGHGVKLCSACSYSARDTYPSEECRRCVL